MVKRICPECETEWYSAYAEIEFWVCEKCGTKISIEFQQSARRELEANSDGKR